ncbi:response regulator transcription factor [Agathobacter sp.]
MNKKILIVEDDHTQNEVLANFLRKENYEVFSAYNISEAKAAINDTFHLVVLDLMLPDGSGLGFLKELRKSSNIPVIVLTALNDEFTQIQSFDLKADEYVDKPVSPVVMVKRISALIERVYGNDEIITIHGYQFDFNNLLVYKEDQSAVSLTAREMNIIHCLFDNKGLTVPRRRLMELVWGYEYTDEDRLLDSHIKNLRHKLDNELIITIKGVGYRLNMEN